MIGSLRGLVIDRPSETEIILDVHGVGYRVAVTTSSWSSLATEREEVLLHVHTHVREDAIVLFGFLHADERRCFEALLGAHGVGPSLALGILSALSPAALSTAVMEEDVDTLCQVPGVGKKTAQRLVLELASRLSIPDLPTSAGSTRTAGAADTRADVRAALVELGYGPDEIKAALEGVPDDGSVSDLVRAALRELARPR